ncbi:aspartyl-tRNA synthetase [Sediminicola sp. YIK13]|uniref:DUF6503 family protein n=1 Tax=Sediminicola sp. YIK13 TaxID=1453352 RepID=UPI0007205805|nr:DUF6503 family protein [Sediminicola sp. YIK13]ALM08307.1 aspartyl-tRNA synthetase [Sediminicola sp. YIK13]
MLRIIFIVFISSIHFLGQSQGLTGDQLLQNAIAYHDPNNNWPTFNWVFMVTMETPKKSERKSKVKINLPEQVFSLTVNQEEVSLEYILKGKDCKLRLNGAEEISETQKKTFNLNCDRALMMKNYYTYLYGLPMKLKDPGTIIDPKVNRRKFKNKEYLVLKVNYSEDVGGDSWYFYFDPLTYAMEIYQFFHDESKNDGEYILLSGEETINNIKMPKTRAWYYNKDNGYLGTDILSKE